MAMTSDVFIVNFKQISQISIVDFKQGSTGWVIAWNFLLIYFSWCSFKTVFNKYWPKNFSEIKKGAFVVHETFIYKGSR